MIRPMRPDEEATVRAIFRACHPDYETKGPLWFFAHPTLVLDEGEILGWTSFTLSPTDRGYVAYLMDTCVRPDVQGKGYGRQLFDARQATVVGLGAVDSVGVAAPHNEPMNHLLESRGFLPINRIPDAFPSGEGVVWMKGS